jgi:5-(carboxyamino)imidazole ribonucleotide mutase
MIVTVAPRDFSPKAAMQDSPEDRPSKSARKREALAAQKLGEELILLKDADLDALELPEHLSEAIRQARRIRSRAAGARQRQYIGKLMREIDLEPILAALATSGDRPAHAARRYVPDATGYNAGMKPLVGIIMGSASDWETMQASAAALDALSIAYEVRVVSAHRTPDLLFEYAGSARARGLEVIIAGAGGAAHLPGMTAAKTSVPVLGVPVQSKALSGLDSLLSIVQMPAGVPVATFAIGVAGATNAALAAAAILANKHAPIRQALDAYRERQTTSVLENSDPRATHRT